MKSGTIVILLIIFTLLSYIVPNYGEVRKVSVGNLEVYIPSNIDSPDFVFLVTHFPKGFIVSNTRISRPLYVVMAMIPYTVLKHIIPVPSSISNKILSALSNSERQQLWINTTGKEVAAAWISLLLINFLLTFFTVYLFSKGLERAGLKEFQFFGVLLILLSFKFDTQILVPHTELFDLLLPSYVFYLISPLLLSKRPEISDNISENRYTLHLVIIGMLFLGKAVLFLYIVCLWGWVRLFGVKNIWKPAVLLPFFNIAYILILKLTGIPYYQHEVEAYRQGVWLFDYIAQKGFFPAVFAGISTFFKVIYSTVSVFAPEVIIGTAFLVAGAPPKLNGSFFSLQRKEFLIVYSISFFLFWTVIGYYPARVLYTFYPVAIFILGVLFMNIEIKRRQKLVFILYSVYLFISFGTTITV